MLKGLKVSLLLSAGLCLGAARFDDTVTVYWPDNRVQRDIIAYQGASLVPLRPSATRPTVEERLAHAPFITGENRVALDLQTLDPEAAAAFKAAAGAGQLSFSSFSGAAEKLYGPRRAPRTLAELKAKEGIQSSPDWQSVEVMSLLTHGKRRISYDARKILEATVTAMEAHATITFPAGTWFMAEQLHPDGSLVETHLLGKRADQELDYLLYDKTGNIGVLSSEFNMRAPTTCFACHRNARRLPPFADFPDATGPVQDFTPAVLVTLSAGDTAILRAFVTSGPRPDDTHGTYGGLAALNLKRQMAEGHAPDWGRALWPRLVKLVPALGR